MGMPPPDMSPDELWIKLQECPRPTEIVDFPRKDPTTGRPLAKIRIQVLTVEEHTKARLAGRSRILQSHDVKSAELDDYVMREIISDACAKEALKLACVSVKPMNPDAKVPRYAYMFPNDERLDALTADEVVTLFNAYTLVQNKYGPFSEDVVGDEEYNAWIRVLTEGAKHHFLARKNSLQLAELAIGLARRGYLLSLIVESLLKDSQSISAADLKNLGIGTSWYTGQLLERAKDGLTLTPSGGLGHVGDGAESLDEVISDALYGFEPGEDVTLERAIEIAKRLND
jgi:hypothetical protein